MYKILSFPHPILSEKMPEFDFANPIVDPIELEKNLISTMITNKGIGLSANQVGIKARVFVMGDYAIQGDSQAYFNPKIIDFEEEIEDLPEGCLSFPNIFVKIKRSKFVHCSWQDSKGEFQVGTFTDLGSKCFQHELDHLDGIVFKDRVSRLKWDLALKKKRK